MYEAGEHVVVDNIRRAVLEETTKKHVDQLFEAGKAAEELGKRWHRTNPLLTTISLFVQMQAMDEITD